VRSNSGMSQSDSASEVNEETKSTLLILIDSVSSDGTDIFLFLIIIFENIFKNLPQWYLCQTMM
jgi:hypothetical protein